jgi:hypothetical protein
MKKPSPEVGRGGSGITGSTTPFTPTPHPASPARPLFGPWSPNVDPIERIAQLRSLAGLVAVHCGSDHPLIDTLRAAETDSKAAQRAFELIDFLPTLTRRKLLSVFASITWRRRA